MLTNAERQKAVGPIHERARYLRGSFLNSVAAIERELALILTEYFCAIDPSKQQLFFENIAAAQFFTLRVKKDVLVKILKQDYSRYYKKNGVHINQLDKIMEFRNKLAHSVIDVSDQALMRPIKDGIGFIEWKEGAPITDREFNDWEVTANMVHSCLLDIKRLLPVKENEPAQQ